ncbi:MobF family relaxase [Nevskia soli]|uniref:MobF family relaxase n=1 Tax=Nevskia soli TaxID=418856 RepID=UPI00068FFC45|nr:MobF family relaxase [Nevskia soli]
MALAKNISAGQADRYYDKDDYYTKDAAAPSQWHGKGARALGLNGLVRPEDFKALVRGELPDGTTLHRGGSNVRRAGTDFEFSAPKSFSIQALVVGDERLVKAHQQAVAVARQRIEATVATRVTRNGKTTLEFTGKAVIAEFLHTTSRGGDPDLHSHVVALNMTQRQDGQWRSVDNEAMYREQRLMYQIYLSELARAAKALGYEITTGKHGNPELAHISREQIEQFSSRAREIEAVLKAQGLTLETATPRQKKAATMKTRRAKQKYDRAELEGRWRQRAAAIGIRNSKPGEPGMTKIGKDDALSDEREAAREAVDFALAHLGEREAAFERREVLAVALRESRVVSYEAINAELNRRQRNGEVMPSPNGQRVTTRQARDIEIRILAIEQLGRGKAAPIAASPEVARRLTDRDLNVGQAGAVQLAATTSHQVVGVQGLAGSGKTTMLRTFQEFAAERGYRILALAPSHSAVHALDKAGIEAKTLQSWLKDREAATTLTRQTVVVLDEAGLVGNKDILTAMERVRGAGARLILVGDKKQYQAVEAGRAFAQLQERGMPTARMDEMLRQRDGRLAKAAKLSVEEPARALKHLEVREISDPAKRYEQIAAAYSSLSRDERSDTLILTGTNEARIGLNDAVRNALKARGELSGPTAVLRIFRRKDLTEAEQKRLDRYAVGDVIQFQKDYRSLEVVRGDVYEVTAVKPDGLSAKGDSGREIHFAPAQLSGKGLTVGRIERREVAPGEALRITSLDQAKGLKNGDRAQVDSISNRAVVVTTHHGERRELQTDQVLPVEYGYAATGHSAQGLGAKRVLMDRDTTAATTNHRSFYTDLTRAKEAAVIYTNDRRALPRAVLRQSEKAAALDVVRDRGGHEPPSSSLLSGAAQQSRSTAKSQPAGATVP